MRNMMQLLGGVAVAGAVAAGSTALTGTGVTGPILATQFVGGTVSQAVTGATLNTVAYGFTDGTKTAVNLVTLTFADADADGKAVSVTPTATGTLRTFTCGNVAATGPGGQTATTMIAYCTPGAGQVGLTSLSITVS